MLKGTSLVGQWLRLHLPMQRVWVRSLVREIRFPHASQPKKETNKQTNIKQKQYCNKFDNDFKNGPHQKKILKKTKEMLKK